MALAVLVLFVICCLFQQYPLLEIYFIVLLLRLCNNNIRNIVHIYNVI